MSAQHTKEPWKYGKELTARVGEWLISMDAGDRGRGIAIAETRPASGDEQANAERIVACVNACAGMKNEELEDFSDGSLKFWIDDADDIMKSVCVALLDVDYIGRCEHGIYALKKQRDELLGTLTEIAEWVDRYTAPNHPVSTIARKAIAKAGGRVK